MSEPAHDAERAPAAANSPMDDFRAAFQAQEAGDLDSARQAYGRFLERVPDHPGGLVNLAAVHRSQGRFPAARAMLRRALARDPDIADGWSNLANVLRDEGAYDDAIAAYRRAVALEPGNATFLQNMAMTLVDVGRAAEAEALFSDVLTHRPGDPHTQWERALNFLRAGQFDRGFRLYEARWHTGALTHRWADLPEWDGSALDGRRIVLHGEQGFGDVLQFVRYAALVKDLGGHVLVEVRQPLARLIAATPGVDEVVLTGSAERPEADCHAPLMSLPRILGTTVETIPQANPYLFVPPGPRPTLPQARAGDLKVGIVWAGSMTFKGDRKRSAGLSWFEVLFDLPNVRFYSLQKGPRQPDLAELGFDGIVTDLDPLIGDFADTAALMQELDLIISTCTSVVHLSGGLGRPHWVALPYVADWRWLVGRRDTPWYPRHRLFRQPRPGDWAAVFAEIRTSLAAIGGGGRQPRLGVSAADSATLLLESAFRRDDGRPRYVMPIPRDRANDAGIRFLARHERDLGGYEYPHRRFLDEHLAAGDTLIDIGAHWGLFSLHAVTAAEGVTAIAVEPAPDNVDALRRWVGHNGLDDRIAVEAAAVGEHEQGEVTFDRDSSMGHHLAREGDGEAAHGRFTTAMTTIDKLAERHRVDGRTLLKIDVEGLEPEAFAGAQNLLASGKVAAILWERGRDFDRGDRAQAFHDALAKLGRYGFAHYRFPHETLGGPLIPYLPGPELLNIVSLSPALIRKNAYARPPGPYVKPLRPSPGVSDDRRLTDAWTAGLIAMRTSDGGRWADPEARAIGAEARTAAIAPLLQTGHRFLDLGAGAMTIRQHLPPDAGYFPIDLVQAAPDTIVLDLNDLSSLPLPGLEADAVLALGIIEYLHDPETVLASARRQARQLLVTYDARPEDRRHRGCFNAFAEETLAALMTRAGWRVNAQQTHEGLIALRAI